MLVQPSTRLVFPDLIARRPAFPHGQGLRRSRFSKLHVTTAQGGAANPYLSGEGNEEWKHSRNPLSVPRGSSVPVLQGPSHRQCQLAVFEDVEVSDVADMTLLHGLVRTLDYAYGVATF